MPRPDGATVWRIAAVAAVTALALAGCTRTVAGAARLDSSGLLPGCPGQGVATRPHEPLSTAIGEDNPRGVPVNTDTELTGVQTLDVVVKAYDSTDQSKARQELTSDGYQDGYQRTWSQGNYSDNTRHTEIVSVYRFKDAKSACAFASWEADWAKLSTGFQVPSVPGVAGGTDVSDNVHTGFAVATKSRYVLESRAISAQRDVADWVKSLMSDAYRAL
jgi:hypothetical protein